MSAPMELDWRTLPLAGTTLIEASAGTGKTWNIALLYLRLLIEGKRDVRQILVTTFTDAAAQELRARIRLRLLDVEALLDGRAAPDPVLDDFLRAACAADGTAQVLARIRLALADIDLAPISTIHGFCRRVLSDFPFDTGVAFTLGELVDEGVLVQDCIEDFWRARFLREAIDPWDGAYVLKLGIGSFAALVRAVNVVDADGVDLMRTTELREWWAAFCAQDHAGFRARIEIDAAFANAAKSALRKGLRALLDAAAAGDPGAVPWSLLAEKLEPDTLSRAGIKAYQPHLSTWPEIRALAQARALFDTADRRVLHEAVLEGAAFVRQELQRRLRARGQTTYAQLIDEVHARLCAPGGAALAGRLRATWPAALIDEFQDTDGRQWQIFERIWRGGEDTTLLLIGDPKQSIYGFRGGDVHSYLAVRESLPGDALRSIACNFRSQPPLLDALNQLYGRAGSYAFGNSGIDYVPVQPGDPAGWQGRESAQPLRLRLLSASGDRKPERDALALERCTDDIVALLADATAGVKPGDIAVLLDTNPRIQVLRDLLIARGVPVVGAGRANVLHGRWAEDLQLLLYALLDPADEYALRGALATPLLGASAADLARIAADTGEWEDQLAWFAHQRQSWERLGPLAVVERVISEQAPRLLAAANGERALTDLRHLGELLQQAAADCYGPEELYAWFVAERAQSGGQEDASRERQLRIESESARVQLMTIHASKGLQFPWVFVPMAWRRKDTGNSDPKRGIARYHDASRRLRLDLGSADFDAHKQAETLEALQERMRNLYVALTRAQTGCVIYAFDDLAAQASVADPQRGALEVLLGAALVHGTDAPSDPWEALAMAIPTLQIDRRSAPWVEYAKAPAHAAARAARAPLPSPRPYFGLYSFTALTRLRPDAGSEAPRGAEDEAIGADPAATEPTDDPPHPRIAALADLKGARFGEAIHGLLEDRLGGAGPAAGAVSETERIVRALDRQTVRLTRGQEEAQLGAVAELIGRTLDAEMAPGLRLGALPPRARCAEFEFTFALDGAQWGQLHTLLHRHGLGEWWPALRTGQQLRGLMKGFVDLVFEWQGRFHVLDYKTNWLGERLADYAADGLEAAMREHCYGLQALIYSVALQRYLAQRIADYDPQRHLGESWYLFVRAVGLAPQAGIWRRRFPQALIDDLDALFQGQELSRCV